MSKKYRKTIQHCYFVSIKDEDGNEIDCDYVFGTRAEAERAYENMLETAMLKSKRKPLRTNWMDKLSFIKNKKCVT